MLIIGEKEFDSQTVSVRQRGSGDLGSMSIEEFTNTIEIAIKNELATNALVTE